MSVLELNVVRRKGRAFLVACFFHEIRNVLKVKILSSPNDPILRICSSYENFQPRLSKKATFTKSWTILLNLSDVELAETIRLDL